MKTLLVVYHSMTGGAEQMARALARGAQGELEFSVRLLLASQVVAEDVLNADGYVFCTPENLASMAGMMKDFFDRCYYAVLDRINGRPYAVMVCAGSDGTNACRQIDRIAKGWRLRPIADALIVCTRAQTTAQILAPKVIDAESLLRCEQLGAAFASGLVQGIF